MVLCLVIFMHAIVKRITNEVVTTLVRCVRPGSDVLASDLRVGNDPLRLNNVLVRSQPNKNTCVVLSLLKTITPVLRVAASVRDLSTTLLQAYAANYMRPPNDHNSQQRSS